MRSHGLFVAVGLLLLAAAFDTIIRAGDRWLGGSLLASALFVMSADPLAAAIWQWASKRSAGR